MGQLWLITVILIWLLPTLRAQPASEDGIRSGPGVTVPKLIHKIEPTYTRDARDALIQGTVYLEVVIDENGEPTRIHLLSPLGFGLDERAQATVEKWKFIPAMKDGKPVKFLVTVEVNFRLLGQPFDRDGEARRTEFNLALRTLQRLRYKPSPALVKTMVELARKKLPAAMFVLGSWCNSGEGVPKDPERGFELIQKAADKNYGPALYEIGHRHLEGIGYPADQEKGLKMIRAAAVLGSVDAQYFLGTNYESGKLLEHNDDRARQFYRLCGAKGHPACQYKLGRLLFNAPDRPERQYIQALAWFQLAAAQDVPEAQKVLEAETPKLSPDQVSWMKKLKNQLVPTAE